MNNPLPNDAAVPTKDKPINTNDAGTSKSPAREDDDGIIPFVWLWVVGLGVAFGWYCCRRQ